MAGRVLGLDAGERRIGVAMSDELRLLATPVAVLDRRNGLAPVLDRIRLLADRESVDLVVVGWPLNADGSVGRQARRAEAFAAIVRGLVRAPVELWDERLSTVAAAAILRQQGRGGRRARGQIDAIAAAVILQDYLDTTRPSQTP